jgi:acyl-coenzyme A thioesterase 13
MPTASVTVTIRLTIPKEFNNRIGNLHGGAAAAIFDNLSSVALAVWASHCAPTEELAARWQTTGVSRTLNTSYLRPVKVGEEVDVLNEVVGVGKNLGKWLVRLC